MNLQEYTRHFVHRQGDKEYMREAGLATDRVIWLMAELMLRKKKIPEAVLQRVALLKDSWQDINRNLTAPEGW